QLPLREGLMSVILECQPGDALVCIQEFHASPEGEGFAWATSRQFQVGERLRYLGSQQDPHFRDRPNGWQVRFEAGDGKHYAATQTYFVTEECWRGIEAVFRSQTPGALPTQPRPLVIGRGSWPFTGNRRLRPRD